MSEAIIIMSQNKDSGFAFFFLKDRTFERDPTISDFKASLLRMNGFFKGRILLFFFFVR